MTARLHRHTSHQLLLLYNRALASESRYCYCYCVFSFRFAIFFLFSFPYSVAIDVNNDDMVGIRVRATKYNEIIESLTVLVALDVVVVVAATLDQFTRLFDVYK